MAEPGAAPGAMLTALCDKAVWQAPRGRPRARHRHHTPDMLPPSDHAPSRPPHSPRACLAGSGHSGPLACS